MSSYEVQLCLLLKDYEFTQEAVDGAKQILKEISDKVFTIPSKEKWDLIITKLKEESRISVFRDIRDKYCTNIEINQESFVFFGENLFKYGNLEQRTESIRRIFTSEILRDASCREIITNHKDKLTGIIENTDTSEVNEFKSIISSLLNREDCDESTIQIAKEIGVRKDKKKNTDEEKK